MEKIMKMLIAILILSIVVVTIYYFTPKTFGKDLDPTSVDHIDVFDGNTGVAFTVENPDDIKHIVENIQSRSMKRSGISLGYSGYRFSVEYLDEDDKAVIPEFIINGENTIRKDPFFYRCDDQLCVEYLAELEGLSVSKDS